MTTPKPASAPPDTLQAIADEMRQFLSGRGNGPPPCVTDWADRIEALAASAQVRDDAALLLAAHAAEDGRPFKPAAEPAPVAQGDAQANLATLKALAKSDPATLALAAIKVIEEQAATLAKLTEINAGHHETMAGLRRHILTQRERAEAAEASLAACRADAERYACVREHAWRAPGTYESWKHLCRIDFDTAIDALRQEAPHAE